MNLAGKKVLVVGLGASGLAAARLCLAQGALVTATDQLSTVPEAEELAASGVSLSLGGHRSDDFRRAELIVLSPGVDPRRTEIDAARQAGAEIIGELELGFRFLRAPALMITGSNGKSTVTSLAGDMLKAAGRKVFVGGNLGIPLCEFVMEPQDVEWAVLEVSSFQIDTGPSLRPRVGVILNITPDHMDRYPDFKAYASSKMNLLRRQAGKDLAILCADDPEIMARKDRAPAGLWLYGLDGPHQPGGWQEKDRLEMMTPNARVLLNPSNSPLVGRFNRQNILAAGLAALACGASAQALQEAVNDFTPLPHRLQFVDRVDEVDFYDDSKGTNVGAVKAALTALDQALILLLGGRDKEGRFAELGSVLSNRVRKVICFGEAGPSIMKQIDGLAESLLVDDLATALQEARSVAQPGDGVLLSPGCASFDAYKNYGQRGDHFQALVREAAHG